MFATGTFADREEAGIINERVKVALARLDPRERFIIEQRVMNERPMTLKELGEHFGFSRERARQLEPAFALSATPAATALALPAGISKIGTAWVYRPANVSGAMPLMVALHGAGGARVRGELVDEFRSVLAGRLKHHLDGGEPTLRGDERDVREHQRATRREFLLDQPQQAAEVLDFDVLQIAAVQQHPAVGGIVTG